MCLSFPLTSMEYHDVLPNIYLLAGWVFMHRIWPGRRAHWVNDENINNLDLDGISLASFCQSRAEMSIYSQQKHNVYLFWILLGGRPNVVFPSTPRKVLWKHEYRLQVMVERETFDRFFFLLVERLRLSNHKKPTSTMCCPPETDN